MPKVVPHHRPHKNSHTPFYEGNYKNHYFAPLPHKMPPAFFTIPQTYVTGYPIISYEFLHRLFKLNQLFKSTHPQERLKDSRKDEGKKGMGGKETQKRENMSQREEKTYRNKEKLLGQAFYAEKRRKFGRRLDRTQDMCARTLQCKSKEIDWFKLVFIPPIKITVRVFPPIKVKEVSIVRLPSHRLMQEAQNRQNLMRTRLVYRSARNIPQTSEKALALMEDKT